MGQYLSYVDVMFAPWMLRLSRVMKHYRGWQDPVAGTRWAVWMDAIETNEHIRNTTSSDDLYIDSYEPYAQNRTGTTGLADITNGGINIILPAGH
jgi:glutathione S-transferase